jgi:hypothetical protein
MNAGMQAVLLSLYATTSHFNGVKHVSGNFRKYQIVIAQLNVAMAVFRL